MDCKKNSPQRCRERKVTQRKFFYFIHGLTLTNQILSIFQLQHKTTRYDCYLSNFVIFTFLESTHSFI